MDAVARFKLFSALCIWLLAVLGGALPFVGGQRISKRVNSVLNMLAAGIFLAGSSLHLLPDAQNNEALSEWACIATVDGGCFQWANFFYGLGFILIVLIEVFAHELHRTIGERGSSEHEHLLGAPTSPNVAVGAIGAAANSGCKHSLQDADANKNGRVYAIDVDGEKDRIEPDSFVEDDRTLTPHSYGSIEKHLHVGVDSSSAVKAAVVHSPSHQEHHFHGMVKSNPILALVVLLALSFHSIMEGMGIGASSREAWDILIAVLAHKSLAAFALVLEFLHHNVSPRQMLASVATFSLMTPIGIFLGSMLVDATHETPASGVCSALAGGTFLYVAIMEIIPQELQDPCHLVPKLSALLAGYSAMGVLSIWT